MHRAQGAQLAGQNDGCPKLLLANLMGLVHSTRSPAGHSEHDVAAVARSVLLPAGGSGSAGRQVRHQTAGLHTLETGLKQASKKRHPQPGTSAHQPGRVGRCWRHPAL
jgi:hypothetical protein